jgi:hypothetical protein
MSWTAEVTSPLIVRCPPVFVCFTPITGASPCGSGVAGAHSKVYRACVPAAQPCSTVAQNARGVVDLRHASLVPSIGRSGLDGMEDWGAG